jgi:NADPH:quinone reductase-like Zn-dependent oxidoreductase
MSAMQAIVHDRYGGLELLEQRSIERPTVRDGQVRVRVRAAGIHVGDLFAIKGSPFPVRFMSGLRRPRRGVPGFDVSGVVEAVGGGVSGIAVGDEVVGFAEGTCAEYTTARADLLVPKPARLTWEEAAAVPTSGLAALNGIRDAARVRPGQRLLVIGASGGVGTFAVQIAHAMGAHVTAVCSGANADLVRSLGADEVIDYTAEDLLASGRQWDVILDNIEDRPLAAVRRLLTADGTLVLNSGTSAGGIRLLVNLVAPLILSRFSRQTLRRYLSTPNRADLEALVALVERGEVRPVVGACHPLSETAEAFRRIESGHARGKVVVTVAPA